MSGSATPSGATPAPADASVAEVTIESAVALAKRAFALKKYEQAVDHYGTALELMTEKYGDDAPETADLYLAYGKALLENAIMQSSVLGRDGGEGAEIDEKEDGAARPGAVFSFTGDVEEEAVDLFEEASKAAEKEEAEAEAEAEEEEGAEPEDDFNAAWEVLELARAIYEKQKDENEEIRLKLADTYITLGDVSLETEKFEQAITDYSAGLNLKTDLLPLSSRQIAEAHYKLSMVLDLTMGRLADAIVHAQKALESVEARLAELRAGLDGTLQPVEEPPADAKGKGKVTGWRLLRDDLVQKMSKAQIEAEIKELSDLKEDLGLKVEELKTSPNEGHAPAPALAAQALDSELNVPTGAAITIPSAPLIHDLTSMVKKKRKPAPEESISGKRKAEDEGSGSPTEKKARLEDGAQS